jgi:hypothetical protein
MRRDTPPVPVPHREYPPSDPVIEARRCQLVEMVRRLDAGAVLRLWALMRWWTSPRRPDGQAPD